VQWQKMEYRPLSFIAMIVVLGSLNLCTAQAKDKIDIKVDYVARLNEIGKAGRAESLNAAPYYEKAFKLSVEQPEQLSKSDLKAWPQDLPDEKRTLLQNWAFANSKALEQLKLGTKKSYYWPEYQGSSMWDIVLPDLAKARSLMYALCSRAKLYASKGNFEQAFSDLLVCYRFGKQLAGPIVLIEQLVGIAVREFALQAGFQILDRTSPPPDLLKDFQQQLEMLYTKQSYVIDFTAEKYTIYDSIQMAFTDDGEGSGHIRKAELRGIKNMLENSKKQIHNLEQPDRRQTTELADKVCGYFSGVVHKTPWQLHNEGKDLEKVIEEMTKDNPFLRMLMPAVGRVLEISFRGRVETDALITTLSLLRYKAERGQLPENLDELVSAGYLKNLPIDVFSGGPLVYKRLDNDFILYSFGHDLDDDGGVYSKWGKGEGGGDQVFWPVERPEVENNKKDVGAGE